MTAPATSAFAAVLTMKLDVPIVDAVIASLNVTVISAARGTDVPAGAEAVTWGAVTSGGITCADAVGAESAETIPLFPFAETV